MATQGNCFCVGAGRHRWNMAKLCVDHSLPGTYALHLLVFVQSKLACGQRDQQQEHESGEGCSHLGNCRKSPGGVEKVPQVGSTNRVLNSRPLSFLPDLDITGSNTLCKPSCSNPTP